MAIRISVISLVFNQEAFLADCLNGVLRQEGDFELEHWVVDDASTDGTAQILEEYAANSSYAVHVLRHAENRGANYGMAEAYGRAQGEYVALCEGDDFWLAPDKLQSQLDLMRRRPDLGLCFHDAVLMHQDRRQWPIIRPAIGAPIQTIQELLHDNRAHTCTVMYRRIPGLEFPDWYSRFTVGDWPNHAFHAARGGIGYIRRPMAAYRLHSAGSWSAIRQEERARELTGMLAELDAHFLFRYSDILDATRKRIQDEIAVAA